MDRRGAGLRRPNQMKYFYTSMPARAALKDIISGINSALLLPVKK